MEGVHLQFYVNEFDKHGGKAVFEWLLEFAKANGVSGGSVFKAVAGYGQHGVVHEEKFFELASEVPMRIDFFLEDAKAKTFIELLKKEEPELFYAHSKCSFGRINGN